MIIYTLLLIGLILLHLLAEGYFITLLLRRINLKMKLHLFRLILFADDNYIQMLNLHMARNFFFSFHFSVFFIISIKG